MEYDVPIRSSLGFARCLGIAITRSWRGRSLALVWLVPFLVAGAVLAEDEQRGSGDSKSEAPSDRKVSTTSSAVESAGVKGNDASSVDTGKEEDLEVKEGEETAPGEKPLKKPKPNKMPAPVPGGDPRGVPDLVVCSQNLKLFGVLEAVAGESPKKTKARYDDKVNGLMMRFISTGCDVIAVQEVMGSTATAVQNALGQLAAELRKRSNRIFKVVTAAPTEGQMTNGFLVALDRVSVQQTLPYGRVELPRISRKQRPRLFSRPPIELQLSVQSRDSESVKSISIVNFHFKSKRGAKDDPTGMEWETYRMEMAEALRQIVEMRHKSSFSSGESLLLLLGDRNSNFDVASARILEGSITLPSFSANGPCRLSKKGLPLCAPGSELPRKLFSVITSTQALRTYPGTFNYHGDYSWLDDIIMPAEGVRYAWRTAFSEGEYDSGLVTSYPNASDHALVYVKLNW